MGSPGLLLAEVGAHPVEAVLAVARFKLLPPLSGWVEDGLRGAVQHGRPVLTEAQAVMSVADAAGWRAGE